MRRLKISKRIQNEQWLNALPDDAVAVAEEINIGIARIIAERIKAIGELTPSDIKKLTNSLQYLGADYKKITKLIAEQSEQGQRAVNKALKQAAEGSDEFARLFYAAKGLAPRTYQSDMYLHRLVNAMAKQTGAQFSNLSQTLVYKINNRTLSLRQMYTRAIDKAIYEVQSGTVDYHTAMRKTVKELSNSMRYVHWESGHTRRLDSHVRQNLIDGIKQLQTEMLDYHGEQFGSDGVELSAHAICAPDHLAVQGRQFSNEEFYKLQTAQDFEDIKGNEYKAIKREIGNWNCRHVHFPIIIGISQPVNTEEQLEEMAQNSRKQYDNTQKMRVLETRLRQLKNQRLALSASGDDLEARRVQRQINLKQKEYREFCQKHDLTPQPERARVPDYRRISVVDKVRKNGIIESRSENMGTAVKIDRFTPCLVDTSSGKIVDTQYSLATTEDLKIIGWNFNWSNSDLRNSEIYKLTLKGDNKIQGLVALNNFKKDNAVYVKLAESAPHNIGKNKKYDGVGGHLFAIAIKKSMERGYGGFVFMDAKNIELVEHYRKTLGAVHIGGVHPYRMYIDEDNAQKILNYYTLEEN